MAKIILDKDLSTAVTISVDNVFERVISNKINGSKTVHLAAGEPIPTLPDVPKTFTTLNITTDAGTELPISKSYNTVENFTTQFFEEDQIFAYNLDLAYEA